MAKVHVNGIWVELLRTAFNELGTPFEEWFLDRGVLDLRAAPPAAARTSSTSATASCPKRRSIISSR